MNAEGAAAQAAGSATAEEPTADAAASGDTQEKEAAGPEDLQGAPEENELDAGLLAQLEQTRTALNERTQDVQRLQAEFQNYRRRVDRDRASVKEIAVANLLTELLPVLDDIGRARDHGELVGGFKSVAESLEMVVAKLGLMQFGKEGEPFDPTVHEALMHSYSPDVTETTCVQILQPGYRIGERTIRPARVGVAEPQPGAQPSAADESAEPEGGESGDAGEPGGSAEQQESGGPKEG
ncbi:nucleotide exchange factor GrpE [Streptomyces sp. AJS327]|nr:nucleotide exchange factor GrpE [Streptomyces sp. AJS327]MBA0052980.1 nucleotide exchange factor GrpE [Streptomyces sp. AJS327]